MLDINVKLEKFEGPLDLLYRLIEKNEIDIQDIPIAEIADQYIEIIAGLPPDMESLSSFVLMASTLLEIKSKMLLPLKMDEPFEEADPREELVRKLLEYKRFKDVSEIFKSRESFGENVVFKDAENELLAMIGSEKPDISQVLEGVSAEKLMIAFMDVLNRKELKVDKIRADYGVLQKEEHTIEDRMEYIRSAVRFRKNLSFFDIFADTKVKTEVIATFLALLELIKLKEVRISQESNFGDITISAAE